MTDKELKRLSRRDLLEMLLEQSRQMQQLQQQLDQAQEKLNSRALELSEAGSIAEAALKINGVFQAAQAAASQYLENIAQLSQRQEAVCRQMEQACSLRIQKRLEEAEKARAEMLAQTERECADRLAAAVRGEEP
ncbi:MAG: hypothetical protein Q4F17_06200 [Eubacteriales bacterium]|nr:hypothetical protein [Eubacteriales bacterium]